jgi:hypothetical protein
LKEKVRPKELQLGENASLLIPSTQLSFSFSAAFSFLLKRKSGKEKKESHP